MQLKRLFWTHPAHLTQSLSSPCLVRKPCRAINSHHLDDARESSWFSCLKFLFSHPPKAGEFQLDWSLLTQAEVLEKANEFGKKAYSSSLSAHSFLMLAMEAGQRYSTATIEMAELAEKTRRVFQLLSEVNQGIARFTPETPSSSKHSE
jgi:hypothetical protein